MKLFLYNTLSRKKEEFVPIKAGEAGVYTCGPTVYNFAHIGNLRAYVFGDILVRSLRYNGLKVKWAMNITNVDDKTIRDSKIRYPDLDPMEALKKHTDEYENYFWADIESLGISRPDIIPHATDQKYIENMKALTKKIVDAGYGYANDGSVYFDVKKYSQNHRYGRLVNINFDDLKTGSRTDTDEYEKENIQDFVLWKGKKEGEPVWAFDLNGQDLPGRPGWHIECSAMGEADLGCPFDIHTGGVDLKFPHHENEIAQSVVGYCSEEPVKVWMHNEFLNVDDSKMSKRFNNFYTLREIEEKGYKAETLRFLFLQTSYRVPQNFTWKALEAAKNGLEHLKNQLREIKGEVEREEQKIEGDVNQEMKVKLLTAINDDLSTPQALAVVQEVLKSELPARDKLATVLDFDSVLGLKLKESLENEEVPAEISKLADERQKARDEKNWAESDRLRDEIDKAGFIVEDAVGGQRVYKK